jgi:F-type H+-transporting ATPase subunit b
MDSLGKIGIDFWGMFLYLINYGLLLGVLGYFFYPKILKTIDERRNTIKKNIEDTAHLQKVLELQIAQHKKEKDELHAQIQKQSSELKKELQVKRTELLAQMDSDRQKMMEETKVQLEKEKNAIVQAAEGEVLTIMKKVLLEVVSQKVPEDVVTESVTDSWNKYKSF